MRHWAPWVLERRLLRPTRYALCFARPARLRTSPPRTAPALPSVPTPVHRFGGASSMSPRRSLGCQHIGPPWGNQRRSGGVSVVAEGSGARAELDKARSHTSTNMTTPEEACVVITKNRQPSGNAGTAAWPHRRRRSAFAPWTDRRWLDCTTSTNPSDHTVRMNPAAATDPITAQPPHPEGQHHG